MISKTLYHHATFLSSAGTIHDLPKDTGAEVAFLGRSNVGKSSAINAITNIKGLARSSKTPGRTQTINFFQLNEGRRLVDLPGYGFAKVPLQMKYRWQETVNTYLETRRSLKGLILIMDIRHPLRESDQRVVSWATRSHTPLHVLLTKADKLSHGTASATLREVEENLRTYPNAITLQLFSALDRTGLDQVYTVLNEWLA